MISSNKFQRSVFRKHTEQNETVIMSNKCVNSSKKAQLNPENVICSAQWKFRRFK